MSLVFVVLMFAWPLSKMMVFNYINSTLSVEYIVSILIYMHSVPLVNLIYVNNHTYIIIIIIGTHFMREIHPT